MQSQLQFKVSVTDPSSAVKCMNGETDQGMLTGTSTSRRHQLALWLIGWVVGWLVGWYPGFLFGFLTHEDATNRLTRIVGKESPLPHCVITQQNAVLKL
jgi:hypothetical protein